MTEIVKLSPRAYAKSQCRTLRIILHPRGCDIQQPPLAAMPSMTLHSDSLGLLFQNAEEIAEAQRREAEIRRREAEAARARFAAD